VRAQDGLSPPQSPPEILFPFATFAKHRFSSALMIQGGSDPGRERFDN